MTIRNRQPNQHIIIDCNGASGTPQALLGQAALWLNERGQSPMQIGEFLGRMMTSDYDNMITVFNKQFGSFCEIIR